MPKKCRIPFNCLCCNKEFEATPKVLSTNRGKYCSSKCYKIYKKSLKIIKICPECGTSFELYPKDVTGKWNRVYCSDECKYKNWSGENSPFHKHFITCNCLNCNKEIKVSPSYYSGHIKIFCSNECKYDYHHIELICEYCNKPFIISTWEQGKRKHCNKECHDKSQTLPLETKNCKYCGTEFSTKVSSGNTKNPSKQFCSYDCAYKFHIGEGNPNWREGASAKPYCWRFNAPKRREIREKFNNLCFVCGKTKEENNENMVVHHIDYNKATLCNKRNWPLITLCKHHHGNSGGSRYYWFNLLISYWAFHPDIILQTFPFAAPELLAITYVYNNDIKFS